MTQESNEERLLRIIREKAEDRRASGQAGGVREWFEVQFLLDLLDAQLCSSCKKKKAVKK